MGLSPFPFSWAAHTGQGSEGNIWLPPRPTEFWIVQKVPARGRAGVLSSFEGELLPSCLGLAFFVGVMSSFCEVCAAASSRKTKQGDETWMSNAKTKQIWFFLFSLPLFLWKGLSSWLYTTGISLIEKESERSRVVSFQFLLSSSQKWLLPALPEDGMNVLCQMQI